MVLSPSSFICARVFRLKLFSISCMMKRGAAADVVVRDNDHDGCAEAIEQFLL